MVLCDVHRGGESGGGVSEQTKHPAAAADVLTAREAAAYLKIPVRSVHLYASRGELPSIKIGRHRRFSRAALEAHLIGQARDARARS